MTVAALDPAISYLEDGVTVNFAVPFRYLAAADLSVSRVAADGTVTALAHGTDWSASAAPTDAGGALTLVSTVAGATVRIRRATERRQASDYATGDRLPADTLEGSLDRAMLIDQEQDRQIANAAERALLVPDGEIVAELPAQAGRAGAYLAFDANGNPIAAQGTGNDSALRADLAADTGALLITFIRDIAGAVAQSLSAVLRLLRPTPETFGAVANNPGFDNKAALDAFLLASTGQRGVRLPKKTYYFQEALDPVVGDNINIASEGGTLCYNGADTTPGDLLTFGEVGTPISNLDIRGFTITSTTMLAGGFALKLNELRDSHVDLKVKGTTLYDAICIEESVKVWFHETDTYSQRGGITAHDCIEIYCGTGYSQLDYGVPGVALHIAGGCGGFYQEGRRTWGGTINVLIDHTLSNAITRTGTTSTSAATITGLASTTGLEPGMTVAGSGVVAGSYVISIDSSSQVTMSQNGAANGSASLSFYNGNSQIFLGGGVNDSASNGASLYIDDDTVRPGGKSIDLGRCWLSSAVDGNAISLVNWGGEITGSPLSYAIVDGYFLNNTDTAQFNRILLGAGTNIGHSKYGIRSDNNMTIGFSGSMHNMSNAEFSETVALDRGDSITWKQTLADGASAPVRNDLNGEQWSGVLEITNETNGFLATFSLSGAAVHEISDPGSFYEASSSPADIGVAYASGAYRIYNASGAAITLYMKLSKLRKSV